MKKKILSVMLVVTLILSFGLMAAPAMAASPGSYSTDMGKVGWGGTPFNITDSEGLNWGPLEVDVTYADGQAIFVITPPVAFNPESSENDNFWLLFDTDNNDAEDFQVGYNTKEPGYTWPENPTGHWFSKSNGSGYQLIPDDWSTSAASGLDQFTATIPVSYLGGPGSDYGFQIGLVKYVHVDDWDDEWGDSADWYAYDQVWSTLAFIFVPLPSADYQLETVPNPEVIVVTEVVEDIIQISIDPTFFDFGQLRQGQCSVPQPLTITSGSNMDIVVSTSTESPFYTKSLSVGTEAGWDLVNDWSSVIAQGGTLNTNLKVCIPDPWDAGIEKGTIIFWAEAIQ